MDGHGERMEEDAFEAMAKGDECLIDFSFSFFFPFMSEALPEPKFVDKAAALCAHCVGEMPAEGYWKWFAFCLAECEHPLVLILV